MRSFINWKVLLGLSIGLTVVLTSLILFDIKRNRDQAQNIINELSKSAQVAQGYNERLKFLLDSITTEVGHLEARISELQSQKGSAGKGTSTSPNTQHSSVHVGNEQSYYMNCGNIVQLDIPQKYAKSKLRYSSESAHIAETPDHGRIIMAPYNRKVLIRIESGGIVISNVEFPNIKNVPEPHFQVYQRGQKVDLTKGAMQKSLSELSLVLEPDPDFKKFVPKDARYRITKWELNVTRGSSVILRRVSNTESLDLTKERSLFKPGDVIRISAMNCERLTYHDEKELFVVKDETLSFPIF